MEMRNQAAAQARREALYWRIGKTSVFAIFTLALGAVINMAQAGYDAADDVVVLSEDMRAQNRRTLNRQMLINTLSEELTEIRHLAAQQQQFREMNTELGTTVARMYGNWIREHKAIGAMHEELFRRNGVDPDDLTMLKPPVLSNDPHVMLHATMVEHMQAVQTSQSRYGRTNSAAIKNFMHARANLARKHMREMMPIHGPQNCPMCAKMNHAM